MVRQKRKRKDKDPIQELNKQLTRIIQISAQQAMEAAFKELRKTLEGK